MKGLCGVIIIILSWIIYYVCCTLFLKTRWNGKISRIIYGTYVCLSIMLTDFLDNNIMFVFEVFMPVIFYKGRILKKEVVYWSSVVGSALLALIIDAVICKILAVTPIEIIEYRITERMVFVLSLVICYYLASLVKIKKDNRLAIIRTQYLFYFLVLMIMLFAIVCFLIQIYQYELSEEILAGIENATCGIFMLVLIINMISFEIFKSSIFQARKYAEEKARLEMYEMQRAHYRLTTEQIKKLSALRHDFKNHLYVIAERIRRGENKEAIAYIDKIGASTEEAGSIIVAENEILATILTVKNVICKNKDIGFVCEIACEKIHIEDMDLNTVVANLLDNAIEASEKCEKDQRNISFKIKDVKQFIVIECCNNCKEKSAGKKHIFQTTKDNKEEHGYGMENIKETVEKYGGQTEFSCESGVFSAKIMMENTGH